MPELLTVRQIDLAVHFDFKRFARRGQATDEASSRFQRCAERIAGLASDPGYLLFYFSTFSSASLVDEKINPLAKEERERIEYYTKLLGPRFTFFEYGYLPSRSEYETLLSKAGLRIDPNQTQVAAYGEYLENCVRGNLAVIRRTLDLSPQNCSVIADLSL